jgi:hypothetical protein
MQTVYPRYEAKQEAELTRITGPRDSAFKFGNSNSRSRRGTQIRQDMQTTTQEAIQSRFDPIQRRG